MAVADPSPTGSDLAPDVEQCECPWGYSGTSCEVRVHTRVVRLYFPVVSNWRTLLVRNVCSIYFLLFVLYRLAFLGFIVLEVSCLEETVCSVNVTTMPLSVTSMECVW